MRVPAPEDDEEEAGAWMVLGRGSEMGGRGGAGEERNFFGFALEGLEEPFFLRAMAGQWWEAPKPPSPTPGGLSPARASSRNSGMAKTGEGNRLWGKKEVEGAPHKLGRIKEHSPEQEKRKLGTCNNGDGGATAHSNPAAAREDAAGGGGQGAREERPSRSSPKAGEKSLTGSHLAWIPWERFLGSVLRALRASYY